MNFRVKCKYRAFLKYPFGVKCIFLSYFIKYKYSPAQIQSAAWYSTGFKSTILPSLRAWSLHKLAHKASGLWVVHQEVEKSELSSTCWTLGSWKTRKKNPKDEKENALRMNILHMLSVLCG